MLGNGSGQQRNFNVPLLVKLDNGSGQQRNFNVPLLVKLDNGSGQCSAGLAADSKAWLRPVLTGRRCARGRAGHTPSRDTVLVASEWLWSATHQPPWDRADGRHKVKCHGTGLKDDTRSTTMGPG